MRATPRARLLVVTSTAAVVAALCLQVAAAPASASSAKPPIFVLPGNVAVAPGSDSSHQQTDTQVYVTTPFIKIKNVHLTFDTSKLPTGATLSVSADDAINSDWHCTDAGSLMTCVNAKSFTSAAPDMYTPDIELDQLNFVITAAAGAPFGTGTVLESVSGDGVRPGSATIDVAVAQPVSFDQGASAKFHGAPGSKYGFNPTIKNT
ncbi:MAG TPA: hypothetical protein VGF84_18175, partial [Micromonosporaceae bacterium]